MSHITEFAVRGLAGRDKIYKQRLDRHVNVFFGPNGSGKTSLLRILNSAMRNDATELSAIPFTSAKVKIYSITYKTIFVRSIKKKQKERKLTESQIGEKEIVEAAHALLTKRSPDLNWKTTPRYPAKGEGALYRRYLPTSRLYLGVPRMAAQWVGQGSANWEEAQLDELFARSLTELWSNYFSDILKAVRDAQQKGLANILSTILGTTPKHRVSGSVDPVSAYKLVSTFLSRQASKRILGTVAAFKRKYSEDPTVRSIVGDINIVENSIQEATAPRNKLQQLIEAMFTGNKKIAFRDRDIEVRSGKKTQIGLAGLSSGEKHVLKIFIETLLAESSSVIIDEPEISMHVDWQKRLIGAMQQLNPNCQMILATHSPEIMAEVEDSKIFRI